MNSGMPQNRGVLQDEDSPEEETRGARSDQDVHKKKSHFQRR